MVAATYWVSKTGNDTTGDGSEGTPWLTIQKAVDNVTADNGDIINVKAGTYAETVTIATGTTAAVGSLMTVLRGYTTTPGDAQGSATDETNPPVVIDGASTRTNCLTQTGGLYGWVIEGLWCKDATGENIVLQNTDQSVMRFCRSSDSGGQGIGLGGGWGIYRCHVDNPAQSGFLLWAADNYGCTFTYCTVVGGTMGFYAKAGAVFYGCVAASCSNRGFRFDAQVLGEGIPVVVGCLVDGDGADTNYGIDFRNCLGPVVVINNVLYDCDYGIASSAGSDMSPFAVHRNNLIYGSATAAYHTTYDAEDLSGFDFTDAPLFVDEANNDYRPVAGSGVINQGYAYGGTGNFDIGPYEYAGGNRVARFAGATG